MFYYKKEKQGYYIWSDNIKWKFWPFLGIFCKNKYFWVIKETQKLEKNYPWYKYSFWVSENRIFIINKKGIEKILEFNKEIWQH